MKNITIEVQTVTRHVIRIQVERPDGEHFQSLTEAEVNEVERKAERRTREYDFEFVREVDL